MQYLKKLIHRNRTLKKYSIYYWWSVFLLLTIAIFSCVFVFSSYYLQSSHYHQEFINRGIEKSKLFSKQLTGEIEKQQSIIHYLALDNKLLDAMSMDNEPAILEWIATLRKFDKEQIYFIRSVRTNKIFSFGQTTTDVKDVLRHSMSSPNFSIYKSSSDQYLLCITQALRVEGNIVGVLGCVFSFDSFTHSIAFNRSTYSILVLENGTFTDILTGIQPTEQISLLQNAMQGITFSALFNNEHIAIPIGMNQLYLYAHTDTLAPNLPATFFTWLLISIPGCLIAFYLALKMAKIGMHSLIMLTSFTGDKRQDRLNLLQLAESSSITEITRGAEQLIEYCDQLIQSEEYKRHTALFKASTAAFVVCDLEGRILEWNEELNTLLGGTKKNLYGLPVKELFGTMDQLRVITGMAHVRQSINAPLDSNNIFRARLRLNSVRKRSQHVEAVIKHLSYANRSSLVFMLYNVTKHVLAEQGLQRAKSSAEMTTKDRHHFYMGLTQEIQPLAEALSQSLILLSETQPTEAQQRHMEQLQFHNELLSELTTNIRNFALLETGSVFFERSTFGLETLLKQVHAATYSRAMQIHSDVCIYLDPALPQEVWFDFSKSLQVLSNLIHLAAKRVRGGTVTLTVTAGEVLNNHIEILFEVCGQETDSSTEGKGIDAGTLPQPEHYGEQGQQLSLAIIERTIKMFAIDLEQNITSSGVHVFSMKTHITTRNPLRVNLHLLLEGRTILLTYCKHNTVNFIGRALSRLGATCTFLPVDEDYCMQVINNQNQYDAVISCGCAVEAAAQEDINKYCNMLHSILFTVNHSFWEPTYKHPNVEALRKPVMVNELLAKLATKLLPLAKKYVATGPPLTPYMALLVAKPSDSANIMQHQLRRQGYSVAQIEDVTQGIDARRIYQPEVILIDTENVTLDGFWLVKHIRDMEEKTQLIPTRIIMFISREHSIQPEYVDPYTLILESNTSHEDLLAYILSLKEKANAVQAA